MYRRIGDRSRTDSILRHVWDHVLETYTRTSEIHQTLCMLLYIGFSISDIYSENTKGMESRLAIWIMMAVSMDDFSSLYLKGIYRR